MSWNKFNFQSVSRSWHRILLVIWKCPAWTFYCWAMTWSLKGNATAHHSPTRHWKNANVLIWIQLQHHFRHVPQVEKSCSEWNIINWWEVIIWEFVAFILFLCGSLGYVKDLSASHVEIKNWIKLRSCNIKSIWYDVIIICYNMKVLLRLLYYALLTSSKGSYQLIG